MITVKIEGVNNVLNRLRTVDANIERVRHDEMPAEMTEWQTEDMKRERPNILHEPNIPISVVATRIWPTSRRDLAKRRRSMRPILRPALQEQLWERMRALFRFIKWA